MANLIALLDKPSKKSLGMVPAVVKESDRSIRVLGLAAESTHRAKGLSEREVKDLIYGGDALKVEDAIVKDHLADDTAALWLGHSFKDGAKEAGVDFVLPTQRSIIVFEGKIFLLPSAIVYRHLEDWTVDAFKKFRSLPSSERTWRKKIVVLMEWALPARPESLAAAWAVAEDPDEELEWQIRMLRHGMNAETLRKTHQAVLSLDTSIMR